MNTPTIEMIQYLRDATYLEVIENRDTMREMMNIYRNDPAFYMNSPTYREREGKRDLLATTLCWLEQQLDALKEEQKVINN
jgi:hypothetical protein